MESENEIPNPERARPKKPEAVCAIGYGIICGLVFPLMLSSTFLQTMSLSHGAGASFGALFFITYSVAMLVSAASHPRDKRTEQAHAIGAFASVFAGNTLMLARHLGLIEAGWPYAITAAMTIGYGLASAELVWMSRIALYTVGSPRKLARIHAGAYLTGGLTAALIFLASGMVELPFALVIILASACLLLSIRDDPGRVEHEPGSHAKVDLVNFVKTVSYLAVFSFVFGAISQASIATGEEPLPIEAQALAGVVIAATIILAASARNTPSSKAPRFSSWLFPVVMLALVALPFLRSPAIHLAATTLVFIAFYLTGISARVIICWQCCNAGLSPWRHLGITLGLVGLFVLAGVAFGAATLNKDNPIASLALISLVSLFVLTINPVITRAIEDWRRETEPHAPSGSVDSATGTDTRQNRVASLAGSSGMTAREAEVLSLVLQGRTRTYIADKLSISPNTVKGYIHAVYQKAGVENKQDLIDLVEQRAASRHDA